MRSSYEESKGPYRGNRGGGDRGRGGGDRGGKGGHSGFASGPRESLVSRTPPGAIKLISNHFKLRVLNSGTITLYSIDFGVITGDKSRMAEAIRNCSKTIEAIVGKFAYHSGHIFALNGLVG